MGTDAWKNWRAFAAGATERENFDDELHSDRFFIGGPANLDPYRLSTVIRDTGSVGCALLLEGGIYADLIPDVVIDGQLARADSAAYHGGTMSDEIGALISLALGVRIRRAGTRRLSGLHRDEGPTPPIYFDVPRLTPPGRPNREMLPRVMRRPADLSGLSQLNFFPHIPEQAQVELVRAARAYSAALWWANEDPNNAWLQLVTSVEIAAKSRQVLTAEPVALLEELWPDLWDAVLPADEAIRKRVAQLLAPQLKATRTFVDFIEECKPASPDPRPEYDQLDWSRMRHHARVIYDHRSKALHSGKPFPLPMLEAPRVDDSGTVQERPWGLNAGGLGGVWDAAQTPMLLSTFEHVARGALLHRWDELIAMGPTLGS